MTATGAELVPRFDVAARTRLVFGVDAVDRLGELARELGGRSALVVTCAGVVAAGHAERALRSLERAGLAAVVFDRTPENPAARDVAACAAHAREARERPDIVIGLGGGSSLDAAKGANFVLTNGGRVLDYRGRGKAARPLLPMIAVPTTAGTGSECNSYAIIADDETHRKMACADPKAAPAIALLDPALTLTQPRRVAADAGVDAISHAVESAVARNRSPLSGMYAREAFRLTAGALEAVLGRPGDLKARGSMLLGSALAGLAIEASMLGAAHSAANPLSERFGAVHGRAVGVMLPHAVRWNAADAAAREAYRDLAVSAGVAPDGVPASEAAEALAARIEALLDAAEVPESPSAFGMTEAHVPSLAEEAARQLPTRFNARAMTARDFAALYASALTGARGVAAGRAS